MMIRPRAKWDLDDAAIWYDRQRRGLGREFLDEVARTFQRIEDHPRLYAIVFRNLRRALTHRFPYCVYYFLRDEEVIVVGVLHSKMRSSNWKSRAEN